MKQRLLVATAASVFAVWVVIGLVWVHSRKAAGLERFIAETRRDPLFYSPFLDTAALRRAVLALEREAAGLQEIIQTYYPATQGLPGELFPTELLDALADTVDATDAFVQEPRRENAEALLVLYERMAAHYGGFVAERREALARIRQDLGDDVPAAIISIGSETSLTTVAQDLTLLKANAAALKEEVRLRRRCLHWGRCGGFKEERVSFAAQEPLLKSESVSPVPEVALPLTVLHHEPFHEASGPYPVGSPCWKTLKGVGEKAVPVYVIRRPLRPRSQETEVVFKTALENYYWDMAKGALPFEKFFMANGVRWNQQLETADYLCADHTFRFTLTTLEFLLTDLKAGGSALRDLRPTDAGDTLAAEILTRAQEIEGKLLAEAVPAVSDFEELRRLWHALARRPLLFPTREAQEKFFTRLSLLENPLIGLPEILNSIVANVELYKMFLLLNKDEFVGTAAAPYYLLFARTHPQLFTFPFARSFWRIPEKPQYVAARPASREAPYKTYHELAALYSAAEISRFILDDRAFLRERLPASFWEEYGRFFPER